MANSRCGESSIQRIRNGKPWDSRSVQEIKGGKIMRCNKCFLLYKEVFQMKINEDKTKATCPICGDKAIL